MPAMMVNKAVARGLHGGLIERFCIIHPTADAYQRIVGQRKQLEGGFGVRPAAMELSTGGGRKPKTRIIAGVPDHHYAAIAKFIEGIESLVDKLLANTLATMILIHRQRRQSHPLVVLAVNPHGAERRITDNAAFIVRGDDPKRKQAVFP